MKKFFVAVKAFVRDERGYVLLGKDYKSGEKWGFPGGRLDGSESFEEGLIRELHEELPGISDITVGELQGVRRLTIDVDKDTGLLFMYFNVTAKLPEDIVITDEHESYIQVRSANEIPDGVPTNVVEMLKSLLR